MGWGGYPPLRIFFFVIFKRTFDNHLPFSVAVCISLRHILAILGENSLLKLEDMTS